MDDHLSRARDEMPDNDFPSRNEAAREDDYGRSGAYRKAPNRPSTPEEDDSWVREQYS